MDHITIDMPEADSLLTNEWMMLCLPGRWNIIDLHQLGFTHRPTTNAEFFARLKLEYDARRYQPFPGWKFWSPRGRKITGIHLVKFRLAAIVTPQDVRVQDNPGLPDEGEEDWVCRLDEYPSQAPLNPGTMLWMLRGEILEAMDVYDLVPRKLHDRFPMERRSEGWGLYFAEEEYWKVWFPAAVLGGTLVVACGARVVLALILEKACGLSVKNDFVVLFELIVATSGHDDILPRSLEGQQSRVLGFDEMSMMYERCIRVRRRQAYCRRPLVCA